jgi:hypothetical protein
MDGFVSGMEGYTATRTPYNIYVIIGVNAVLLYALLPFSGLLGYWLLTMVHPQPNSNI